MVVDKKKSFKKFLTIGIIIALIASLIVTKIYNPTFPLGVFVVVGLILATIGVILIKGKDILAFFRGKSSKEAELPPALSLLECRAEVDKALGHRFFFDTIGHVNYEITPLFGQGQHKQGVYVIQFEGRKTRPARIYTFLINQHYPEKRAMKGELSDYQVTQIANSLVTYPEENPTTIKTTERNPILGIEVTKEEVIPQQKKDENLKPAENLE